MFRIPENFSPKDPEIVGKGQGAELAWQSRVQTARALQMRFPCALVEGSVAEQAKALSGARGPQAVLSDLVSCVLSIPVLKAFEFLMEIMTHGCKKDKKSMSTEDLINEKEEDHLLPHTCYPVESVLNCFWFGLGAGVQVHFYPF